MQSSNKDGPAGTRGTIQSGASSLPTLAIDPTTGTVAAQGGAGLGIHLLTGGGQIDEQIGQYAGADAYSRDAMVAVSLAKERV